MAFFPQTRLPGPAIGYDGFEHKASRRMGYINANGEMVLDFMKTGDEYYNGGSFADDANGTGTMAA